MRIQPWITLARAKVAAATGLLFWIGGVSAGAKWNASPVAIGAIATFFLNGQANILNDIADRHIDAIDQPWRPLPSGEVSLNSARAAYLAWVGVSLLAGCAGGTLLGVWVSLSILLSAAYCIVVKSSVLAGNVVVAGLSTSPLLIGASVVGGLDVLTLLKGSVLFCSLLAFEVNKTARDVRGDAAGGLGTVAARCGVGFSIRLSMAFLLGAFVLALACALVSRKGAIFGFAYLGAVGPPLCLGYGRLGPSLSASEAMSLFRMMSRLWVFVFLALVVSM